MTAPDKLIGTSGPLPSLIGTYCLILSYSKNHEIEHTLKKGKTFEGTVTEMIDGTDHLPSEKAYRGKAPKVEFRTQNGSYKHFSITYRKNNHYQVGQKVKIYLYLYKSRRKMALEDDEPGTLPITLLKWGIGLCLIGYPLLFSKLGGLI
jgi:hypothetical protein